MSVKTKIGGVVTPAARYIKTAGEVELAPFTPRSPLTELNGNNTAQYGIQRTSGNEGNWINGGAGGIIQNQYAHNHTRDNCTVMNWSGTSALPVAVPTIIRDCRFYDASASPPLSLNGTAEANLWVGATANVDRVDLRRGAWMGLWTGGYTTNVAGGCSNSTFNDMSITEQRVGIYVEHVTHDCVFSNIEIQASQTGINVEWWYDSGDKVRGSYNCIIEDFDITVPSGNSGIMLDAGNNGFTIRNGIIRGGGVIRLPNRRVDPAIAWSTTQQPENGPVNTVTNVVNENGSPVSVIFHNNAIGWTGQ